MQITSANHAEGKAPTSTRARPNMRALSYRNDRVVSRMVTEYGLEPAEAQLLFEDTLKFLALTDSGIKLSPAARIDLGWHNFVLHTREYAEFCQEYFGHFIHHEPGSGLECKGPMLDVVGTALLAEEAYGDLSPNWLADRGATCGSGGC